MIFLTEDNYYSPEANWDYMSVSQLKDFLTCESMAMAKLTGEYKQPPSDAMLVGSYVDAWCEGTLDEFVQKHPEIFNSRKKDELVLKADFQIADKIIEKIKTDPLLMSYLSGNKQTILTAYMYGCMWKIRMDNYVPDIMISDLKIMKSIDDKYWIPELRRYGSFVESYKYNFQMNVYTMVEAIATNRDFYLPTYLVVCTKETPPKTAILEGFEYDMNYVQSYLEYIMPHILQVKSGDIDASGCGKCEHCRSTMNTNIYDYHYIIG